MDNTRIETIIGSPKTKALLVNLRQEGRRYFFQIKGDRQEFWDAVRLVKNSLRPRIRHYDDETKTWSVPAKFVSKVKLSEIFANAEMCFKIMESQLRMF